jgi:hypothetical protein
MCFVTLRRSLEVNKTLIGILAISLTLLLSGCGDDDDNNGACVSRLGTLRQCANDVNAQQCSWLGGTLYIGQTCDDLGFKSG